MITSNLKWTDCYHTLCVKTVKNDLRADSRSDDGEEVRKLSSLFSVASPQTQGEIQRPNVN